MIISQFEIQNPYFFSNEKDEKDMVSFVKMNEIQGQSILYLDNRYERGIPAYMEDTLQVVDLDYPQTGFFITSVGEFIKI